MRAAPEVELREPPWPHPGSRILTLKLLPVSPKAQLTDHARLMKLPGMPGFLFEQIIGERLLVDSWYIYFESKDFHDSSLIAAGNPVPPNSQQVSARCLSILDPLDSPSPSQLCAPDNASDRLHHDSAQCDC